MQDQRERRWMARQFHAGVSVAAVAVLAVACRDAKPTEAIRAIGAKPQNVCFVKPGATNCSCDAIPGPPFWTGVWPDCTQVPSLFHIKITVDSATLALGDTTLFRVTAPGATTLQVQSYSFVPTSQVMAALRARPQRQTVPRSPTVTAGTTANPLSLAATFLMPATAPSQHTVGRPGTPGRGREGVTVVPMRRSHDSWGLDTLGDCTQGTQLPVCYYAPPQSGYMLVMGMVDGEQQRDSVFVRVVQNATLVLDCPPTIARADSITCSIRASQGGPPFSVDSILATPYPLKVDSVVNGVIFPPGMPPTPVLDSTIQVAAGGTYSFGGIVALDTRIDIFAHLLPPGSAPPGSRSRRTTTGSVPSLQRLKRTPNGGNRP